MVGIRSAAATDSGAIATLMTQLGYPRSRDDAAARLDYWLGDPMSRVLVAERDGVVIGCLSLHAVPYLERTGRWARIESLVVDRPAQPHLGRVWGAIFVSDRKAARQRAAPSCRPGSAMGSNLMPLAGAPGRIRTCAHGSGGRCSLP
jgi:hypothetical protein